MSILTKSFKIDFTQVPNEIINDFNVSLKAKGLYLYMVSKPDNWEFSLNGMESQLKESRSAILRIIDELCNLGYMDKIKNRIGSKQAVNDYVLHLSPILRSESQNETHKMRLTKCDSQNETTSNTIPSNKEKVIKKKDSAKAERKEKNFKKFKYRFIKENKGQFFITRDIGWLETTLFTIAPNGLIYNTVSKSCLNKEDAFKVWEYLFNHENK